MRRHRTDAGGLVPTPLRTFTGHNLDDWRTWHRARRAHYADHPDAWPDLAAMLIDSYQSRPLVTPRKARTR